MEYIKSNNIMWKNILYGVIVLTSVSFLSLTKNTIENSKVLVNSSKASHYEPIVVLELFTSQGCSSCPSADLLLQNVKDKYQNEVFALSYHVDYWNYIGWKDPFSKVKYGEKQRKYNIKFRNNSNYTPQLVVNGKQHFVGSNSAKMQLSIDAYKEKKSVNQVSLNSIRNDKENISFAYTIEGAIKNKKLRALLVIDERTTAVKRGENRNRTLQNSNIVVEEQSIAITDKSGSAEISIPKLVKTADKLNLIVLVENLDYDITGAVKQSVER